MSSLLDQVRKAQSDAAAQSTAQKANTRQYSKAIVPEVHSELLLTIIEEQYGEQFKFDPEKVMKASKNKAGQSSTLFWLHRDYPVSQTIIHYRSGTLTGDGIDIQPLVQELERRLGVTVSKKTNEVLPWE